MLNSFPEWLFHLAKSNAQGFNFSTSSAILVFGFVFFFFFLITAIPVGIKQYVILAFICICLMINNAVHLLMCLLATCMPSLENVHSSPVPGFELDCFVVVEL